MHTTMSPKQRRRPRQLDPVGGPLKRYRISITEYDRASRTFKSVGIHGTFNADERAQVRTLWKRLQAIIRDQGWRNADVGSDPGDLEDPIGGGRVD